MKRYALKHECVTHIAIPIKGQSSYALMMAIFEDGDHLGALGVPHTDVRLFTHLSCGHQAPVWVQRQAVLREKKRQFIKKMQSVK